MKKKTLGLFAMVVVGSGCATTNPADEPISTRAQLNVAAQQEDCNAAAEALATLNNSRVDAEVLSEGYLVTAHACIISGQHGKGGAQAEQFLDKFPAHPSADYAAYLAIMGDFLQWRDRTSASSKKTPAETIDQGRALLSRLVQFRGEYPSSSYLERLIPVAKRLRERIAEAELTLAEEALADGDLETASLRARYIRIHYANTQAGEAALDMLGEAQQGN